MSFFNETTLRPFPNAQIISLTKVKNRVFAVFEKTDTRLYIFGELDTDYPFAIFKSKKLIFLHPSQALDKLNETVKELF